MPFVVAMIKREHANRNGDWYFCLTRISKKIKNKIQYWNVASVCKPIPHSNKYPVLLAFDTALEKSDLRSDEIKDDNDELIRKHQSTNHIW